jgi:outer membrane immunogenic protein
MRRFVLAAVSASIASFATVPLAAAADFPVKAPYAPYVPAFTWTGFYVGAHGGWGWSTWDGSGPIGASSVDGDGWLAGIQAGYNYQWGNIVLGIEGEFSFADVKFKDDNFFAGTLTLKNDYFATVAGRVGYAFNRFLVYGKGGVAFTRDKWDGNDGAGGTVSGTFNRTGWLIGAGVEYAMWNSFSIKAEYNFMSFGNVSEHLTTTGGLVAAGTAQVSEDIHIAKVGLNYRF